MNLSMPIWINLRNEDCLDSRGELLVCIYPRLEQYCLLLQPFSHADVLCSRSIRVLALRR